MRPFLAFLAAGCQFSIAPLDPLDGALPVDEAVEMDAASDGARGDGTRDGASTDGSDGGRKIGDKCASGVECASGHCVTGYCCDATCDQPCLDLCNVVGNPGHCSPEPPTTVCAPAGCSGDAVALARNCDGMGACGASPQVPCGNYTCDPMNATCFTACNDNKECAMGKNCNMASHKCM